MKTLKVNRAMTFLAVSGWVVVGLLLMPSSSAPADSHAPSSAAGRSDPVIVAAMSGLASAPRLVTCPTDVNGDNQVNIDDLLAVITTWGPCPMALCGNGILEPGEQCDDGNITSGDGCSSTCQLEAICGNGILEGAEECDDGNTVSGDGCSATCQHEIFCGDGIIEGAEECDDGNTTSGDGCSSTCHLEAICGNGILEGAEECDDGNTTSGDGCSATCQSELQFEVEPNNTIALANGPLGGTFHVQASINPANDVDFFAFTLSVTSNIDIQTSDATGLGNCGGGIDTVIELRNGMGVLLVSDDQDGPNSCSRISSSLDPAAANLPPGIYYVRVIDFGQNTVIPAYQLHVIVQHP